MPNTTPFMFDPIHSLPRDVNQEPPVTQMGTSAGLGPQLLKTLRKLAKMKVARKSPKGISLVELHEELHTQLVQGIEITTACALHLSGQLPAEVNRWSPCCLSYLRHIRSAEVERLWKTSGQKDASDQESALELVNECDVLLSYMVSSSRITVDPM